MDRHVARLAAQRDVAERLIGESMPGEAMGERAHQDLAR
jgi:hypothetical protein